MNYTTIANALKSYNQDRVSIYINYLKDLERKKNSDGSPKNAWFKDLKEDKAVSMFKAVAIDNLFIDGETILVGPQRGQVGPIYTYHAYKNKLLLIYPDTKFDIQNVYNNDKFTVLKNSGKVIYKHEFGDCFDTSRTIVGCYCIIKNSLGEFIETLDLEEIKKIKNTAKTGFVWKNWFSEMTLKSVIKRACKRHFKNIVNNMDKIDHENNDPDEVGIDVEVKDKITSAKTLKELGAIYEDHKLQYEHDEQFVSLLSEKRSEIESAAQEKEQIGDQMLNNAIQSIKEGDTDRDEFLERYYLSKKQFAHFEKSLKDDK